MNAKLSRGRPRKESKDFESRNEQILDAAAEMFATRGYADTDVEELAATIGIGKGTIYRAFNSKQELFFATLSKSIDQMYSFIVKEVGEKNVEGVLQIEAGVRAFLKFFDQNPHVIELFVQERAVFSSSEKSSFWEHCRKNSTRWEAFFADLMAKGYIRKLNARWVADTLNQLLYGQLFLHRLDGNGQSLESRSRDILTLFFVGILTKNGLEKIDLGVDLGGLYE
ncbi:MAG: TetR/AcrR family transcriptional regulator [Candidatus Obscuribacterales bacterium]|nr:TetR/AcrR family transcriptional regulator [Candidatus Obscuribacterales bacterium]